MEVRDLLRKLEPLLPQQVDKWRQILATAQSEVRILVERQIRIVAELHLGDYERRILLSLPPKELSTGQVHLGKVWYEQEKWDFSLQLKELTQNLAIFGRSGAGKTNVSFHLLNQLVDRKIGFLFLDWKRTVRHLLPKLGRRIEVYTPGRSLAPFPFNPFIVPPGVDSSAYVNLLVDVMADAYTLGDGAVSVFQQAVHTCYAAGHPAPSIQQILDAIDAQPSNARSTGWKISARRACESLLFSNTVGSDAQSQQLFAQRLLHGHTIIELDGLAHSTKRFLIPLLCHWIYTVCLADDVRESLRFVIFLEEAHHTIYRGAQRSKETLMNGLLRQCRELGMGIVIIDQHPHLISSAGIGNCYTTICMNQKDPVDVSKAAGLSGVGASDQWAFQQLAVGKGIVKLQDRWRQPFLVQFPLVDIPKGKVTDALLAQLHQGKISWSSIRERDQPRSTASTRSRAGATRVEPGAVQLLHDVVQHPQDGVDSRYRRLGVSAEKGNRWKLQLLEAGLVAGERRRTGRTYRVVLKLTHDACQYLTPQEGGDPQASFLHEYWKARIATALKEKGFRVTLEAPRHKGGGKMDISAARASEQLAVEIETGKSDVVANVKRDLLAGVQRVIVVAVNSEALAKVERQLAASGLLISGKVEMVMGESIDAALEG